jgi:hypothetical protein
MNRIGLRFSFVGAIVIVGVAAPLLIQRHVRIQWRARTALFQQQAERFAELSAENKRLSALVAQTRSASLSSDQLRELMNLRGQIGQLRQDASELASYQATHQHRLSPSESSEPQSVPPLPDPQTVQVYWPKAQLTFAGYTNTLSALQTTLWAMTRNDPNALAASVTPETRSNLVDRAFIDQGSPADRIAAQANSIADSLDPASGFYVVGQDLAPRIPGLNPDLHIFNVYFEKEGATCGFALKRNGDEWTFDGIYITGGNDSEPQLGPKLWP